MDAIVFIGGGKHLLVAAEIAQLCGVQVRGVLDSDLEPGSVRAGLPVLGGDEYIRPLTAENCKFHISITSPHQRSALREKVAREGGHLQTLIHPNAVISASARIEAGCLIAVGAIVGVGAFIGPNVVINTGAQIDHDCRIGPDCHIGPGAILAGTVTCLAQVFVASGAIIAPNLTISAGSRVGAGAVVLDHVRENITVVGAPASEATNGRTESHRR